MVAARVARTVIAMTDTRKQQATLTEVSEP